MPTSGEQRDLVRRGYNTISRTYRKDDDTGSGAPTGAADYRTRVNELGTLLDRGATVLDLGCGAGIPATKLLADSGFAVIGVDFSEVQVERARNLVPNATFVCADMALWECAASAFDAVVSFYALIHLRSRTSAHSFFGLRSGFARTVTSLPSSGTESGPGSRTTWAHRCSGTTRTRRPISPGSSMPGSCRFGIVSSRKGNPDIRWCLPSVRGRGIRAPRGDGSAPTSPEWL